MRQVQEPPHPSPLPEGEGADRVEYKNYIDLKVRSRTQTLKTLKISSLSQRERELSELPASSTPTCKSGVELQL
ncbi:hypothetical protein A1354_28085 [Pseudomonas asplenii]|nr:hypothetical protein A1354_28085 [Pseudomonas asplenii]